MKRVIESNEAGLNRRDFLGSGIKLGLVSSGTLALAGAGASLSGCGGSAVQTAAGYRYLRADDILLFTALCPVVLAPAAQAPDFAQLVQKVLRRIDNLAFNLDEPNRKTVYQLLDLLNMRLTRWLATGMAAPWQDASPEDIATFLAKWRDSSFELFNVGYRALTKFVSASFFSLEDSRQYSGYPGPQAWAMQALGQPAASKQGNNSSSQTLGAQ